MSSKESEWLTIIISAVLLCRHGNMVKSSDLKVKVLSPDQFCTYMHGTEYPGRYRSLSDNLTCEGVIQVII